MGKVGEKTNNGEGKKRRPSGRVTELSSRCIISPGVNLKLRTHRSYRSPRAPLPLEVRVNPAATVDIIIIIDRRNCSGRTDVKMDAGSDLVSKRRDFTDRASVARHRRRITRLVRAGGRRRRIFSFSFYRRLRNARCRVRPTGSGALQEMRIRAARGRLDYDDGG